MDRHAPGSLNLSVPHVTIPLEQAWDLVPVHHIQNFQIILWAPAGLEAELLGGVWSLKPLNGNAIWLDDRFMSPRISPFLPRRGDYLLRKRYRTRMDMVCTISHKRDPRLIIDFTARRGFPSFPCPGKR
jgi:hypothetical protein